MTADEEAGRLRDEEERRARFAAWLKAIMAERGLKAAHLADLCGLDPSTIGLWLDGSRNLGREAALALAEGLRLPQWVVFHAGGILTEPPLFAGEAMDPKTDELYHWLRRLTPAQREVLLAMAKTMESQEGQWGNEDPKPARRRKVQSHPKNRAADKLALAK